MVSRAEEWLEEYEPWVYYKCPACGYEVPEFEDVCPYCGYDPCGIGLDRCKTTEINNDERN